MCIQSRITLFNSFMNQIHKKVNQKYQNISLNKYLNLIQTFQTLHFSMSNFEKIIKNNKKWAQKQVKKDPNYFKKHLKDQRPTFLWIGCSDSRIPAQMVMGLQPGELFVHRNIANQVCLSDINTMSVIQYAVQVLEVTDIIVAGHYGCGGIHAAFEKHDFGALEAWLSHIRQTRIQFRNKFTGTQEENENLLVQLNVKSQVYDIAKIPCVQKTWVKGKELRVHGLVYQMENGVLKDLGLTLNNLSMIPEEFWIYDNKMVEELATSYKKIAMIMGDMSKKSDKVEMTQATQASQTSQTITQATH